MKVTDLRGILAYIPGFRDKVFVLSLDGLIVADDNFPNLILDLAVLRSLNIRLVIVHGAAHQIKELADEAGTPVSNYDGTGITDAETLKLALTAANRLTHEIMEGLSSSDLRSCYCNAIVAHPYGIVGGIDRLFTGRVEKIDVAFLNQLLDRDVIPVIPPLGFDGDGRTYRVNSDSVALDVAVALKASKLIYVSTARGFERDDGIVNQLSVLEAEEYFKKNRANLAPQNGSKLEHAIRACKAGVSRVHILDGRDDEALLAEIFSNEGVGTMIYANEYQAVRRALKKDVRHILALIRQSVEQEEIVKRTRATILAQLQDYYVFEIDGSIIGCVALHVQADLERAELACLSVRHTNENSGVGQKLMHFAENVARDRGVKCLYLLSTRAFAYFQQKGGYQEGTVEDLPPERLERYIASGRKSKILVKHLK